MKARFLTVMILSTLTLLIVSCSKDVSQDTPYTGSASQAEVSKMAPGDVKDGGVRGAVSPAKISVTIYLVNEFRTYGPFFSEPSTGLFKFGNVIPGDYKLIILNPYANAADDWSGAVTMPVTIQQGTMTDVGVINL